MAYRNDPTFDLFIFLDNKWMKTKLKTREFLLIIENKKWMQKSENDQMKPFENVKKRMKKTNKRFRPEFYEMWNTKYFKQFINK